jgi:hypothetical protein
MSKTRISNDLLKMGPASFTPKFKKLDRPDPDAKRTVGFGAPPDLGKIRAAASPREGLGSMIDMIRDSMSCPIWNMPVIEQVRWTLLGPITDFSVKKNFGAQIDLFGSDKNPEGIDYVETTMAQVGELQTHTLACAIGFHLEPAPLCWTVDGNGWTHPTASAVQPPSPDVFTQNDRFNGALGANFAGANPTQVILPAQLEWGWWANLASWFMVRGYDLRWRIGQHTNIMDEILRHTAYMPPNAQEGSASSSEVDVDFFVRQVNDRYEELGTALDFLKVNRIRIGSVGNNGGGGPNLGIFRPSRDHERVGATYGGMDLRSMLKANSEFRQLAIPYVIKAGVPIGLFAQEADTTQADLMRQYLSITQGEGGAIPPMVTDASNIIAGPDATGAPAFVGGTVALERTFDGFNVSQAVDSERVVFKGGELKITLAVKGFEVTDDWYTMLQNNPDLRDLVMCECGCAFAKAA